LREALLEEGRLGHEHARDPLVREHADRAALVGLEARDSAAKIERGLEYRALVAALHESRAEVGRGDRLLRRVASLEDGDEPALPGQPVAEAGRRGSAPE